MNIATLFIVGYTFVGGVAFWCGRLSLKDQIDQLKATIQRCTYRPRGKGGKFKARP